MTEAYRHGFVTKCAECGVDADTASKLLEKRGAPIRLVRALMPLFKRVATVAGVVGLGYGADRAAKKNLGVSQDRNTFLRNLANNARETAYLGGYEDHLPAELAAGSTDRLGNWVGRLFRSDKHYEDLVNSYLSDARDKYQKLHGTLPGELDRDPGRMAMRQFRRAQKDYTRIKNRYNDALKVTGLTPLHLQILQQQGAPFTGGLTREELDVLRRYGNIPARPGHPVFQAPPDYNFGRMGY